MKKYDLLPFDVIQAAASGDYEAMSRVMQYLFEVHSEAVHAPVL